MSENLPVERTQKSDALSMFGLQTLYSSLDPDIKEHRLFLLQAMQSCEFDAQTLPNQQMEVTHVVAHIIHIEDMNTQEPVEATRVVLIDDSGASCGFVSAGVKDSIRLLIAAYGEPPWIPPLLIEVKERQTRSKRRMLYLHVKDDHRGAKNKPATRK
jgi:hypothetical protein